MATLSDVASAAGVSVSIASRVLSGDPRARVSADTRMRVRDAARSLGYRPNFAGRALRLARTDVVALIVPDLTNPLVSELVRGVEDEARARGLTLLLGRSEDLSPSTLMLDRLLGEGRADGVILQTRDDSTPEEIVSVLSYGTPVVTIHQGIAGASSVLGADARAAEIAVDHLIDLGHERIGYLGGLPVSATAIGREAGFHDAMARAGRQPAFLSRRGFHPAQGAEAIAEMLARSEPPTAVVIANVNAAIGAIRHARRLGVAIPEQLSVVAVHDSWAAENSWPPLTTVRMPLHAMGRAAVRALAESIAGGPITSTTIATPEPELIIRESTRPR